MVPGGKNVMSWMFLERFAVNEDFGQDDLRAVRADLDHAAAIAQIGHHFQRHPAATEARQGKGVQPKFDKFLNIGGIEDGMPALM